MTRSLIAILLALAVTAPAQNSQMSLDEAKRLLRGQQAAFIAVAKQATPAVVYIEVERETRGSRFPGAFEDLFDLPPRKEVDSGSGVVIASDGLIVTNNHLVRGAQTCKVRLSDGRTLTGKVLGSDPATDIGVVKVDGRGLPAVKWGDSSKLQVGEWVLAIGNPYGLEQTVTAGIVSAMGRKELGVLPLEDFIQTDAAINPGNSGGALVNVDSELVGINSVIFTQTGGSQGIGFAIPANMTRSIVDEIVKTGKVERGWLGIVPTRTSDQGATVYALYRGQPAHLAGLGRGDRIVALDGKTVRDAAELRRLVVSDKPGREVTLTVLRYGEEKPETVRVRLGRVTVDEDGVPLRGI